MFKLLQLTALVLASGAVLALVFDGFADAVSRALEAALDSIEYRLALHARSRRARPDHARGGGAAALEEEQTTT